MLKTLPKRWNLSLLCVYLYYNHLGHGNKYGSAVFQSEVK